MKFFRTTGLIVLMASAFVACKDDDTEPLPQDNQNNANKVAFEATDAPLDNVEVYGAFVTVSEIWVDGNRVEGYNKTTFELSALTNGKTEMMKEFDLDASSMNEVIFKLDYDKDAKGNTPGTYILKADGSKDMMKSTTNEIKINKNFDLNSSGTNTIVFDFDLRKMVREESNGDYELVSTADLNASIRAVLKTKSGNVMGEVDDKNNNLEDKTIIYLYKTGDYDAEEMNGNGRTTIAFQNAKNSVVVDAQGNFQLSYISDEGEYELYIFTYDDDDNNGTFEISGMAQLLIDGNTSFNGSELSGGVDLELKLSLETILPL